MGGNKAARHYTALQCGRIHRILRIGSIRNYALGYTDVPLLVKNNQIWDYNYKSYQDIVVDSNAVLTIQCRLEMVPQAKIIVKPGGRLIVDGGILTNSCSGEMWRGIEVWGNSTANQNLVNGGYQQGYLELKNGAVIENAISAVELWKPGDYSKTGGIIHATNAVFRNNAKSVHALCYQNTNPVSSGRVLYNSFFRNCTFEVNENYIGNEMFYKHVDLAHVNGISFLGCNFILNNEGDMISEWNHSIAAYNAGFTVNAICNSLMLPCPETSYDRSAFVGFYNAISSNNDGSASVSLHIRRSDFLNNAYGVKMRQANNAIIIQSNFEIGKHGLCGAGIFSDCTTGFTIEENYFTKYAQASADYFGIIINGSESSNTIYKNTFNGLTCANFADGKNWNGSFTNEGLLYLCNTNSNNYADFYVSDTGTTGVQSLQGSLSKPAGNTFSQNGVSWHFYNGGDHLAGYYYDQNNTAQIPASGKLNRVFPVGVNATNDCPSHYGNSAVVLDTAERQAIEQGIQ